MTIKRVVIVLLLLVVGAVLFVAARNFRDESPVPRDASEPKPTLAQVERGRYLTRAGNCMACHTARGGMPYAGGAGVETPFGVVYSSNLTPDPATGIGEWNSAHFWRAMHNGRSKSGRLLYPAFPYPNYTRITREDSDAIFAYLRSLPAVESPNRDHDLRFPYDSQIALALWRAFFFDPETHVDDTARSPEWNRGAYLVRGLGHCSACHARRNPFGATKKSEQYAGDLMPEGGWYAPSLMSPAEASVAQWDMAEIVRLLKTGVSERGAALGPMANVVFDSTQYLTDADLVAMASYLKALPDSRTGKPVADLELGAKIYEQHCSDCHGKSGEGKPGAYPALAGNRAVTLDSPANPLRIVLLGGFAPATAGNPRPYGMPPFAHALDDTQVSAVVSYIRGAWGNLAAPISEIDVIRYREGRMN